MTSPRKTAFFDSAYTNVADQSAAFGSPFGAYLDEQVRLFVDPLGPSKCGRERCDNTVRLPTSDAVSA